MYRGKENMYLTYFFSNTQLFFKPHKKSIGRTGIFKTEKMLNEKNEEDLVINWSSKDLYKTLDLIDLTRLASLAPAG